MSTDDTPPRVPVAMWWSPSLASRRSGLGFIRLDDGRLVDGRGIGLSRYLPDDAVELHPTTSPPALASDPCGDTETACPHCGDCACTRCRLDAEIHAATYGPVAAEATP